MDRFFGIAQDVAGNIIPSVAVTVNLAGTGTLATLFSDNAYTPQTNPFTSETDGAYQFYARDGRYDITLVKAGFSFDADDTANVLLNDPVSTLTPPQITSNQNDYAPTNGLSNAIWRLTSDAARTITGIAAGNSGQRLTLENAGSFAISITNDDAASAVGNRILTSSGGTLSLGIDGSITLVYDATTAKWRTVAIVAGTVAPTTGIFTAPGTLVGLTLSNNVADAVNDIDITTGAATSDDATITNRDSMLLSTALTKQSDVNWAVGTNQGMLDTGVVGNGTYHVFEIKRTDTNVVDVLSSLSATAPTMPANYNKKRRIGSIVRLAGTVISFVQVGDYFQINAPQLDTDALNPGTGAVLRALNIPTGLRLMARYNVAVTTTGIQVIGLFTDPLTTDNVPSATTTPLSQVGLVNANHLTSLRQLDTMTDTSAQIRSRVTGSDGGTRVRISCFGWFDRRGRDD